jgi:hypothetical protein
MDSTMFDDEEFITIQRYINPLEAEMAKGRLDSAGIPNVLLGENTAILYGTGLGGLQLQVRPQDEEDARAILSESAE